MKTIRISAQDMQQRIARYRELKPLPIQQSAIPLAARDVVYSRKLLSVIGLEDAQTPINAGAPIRGLGIFVAIVMGFGACFGGMNTMYAAVAVRTREIGTLRALGFSKVSIMTSFVIESVILALIGGVIGCIIALPVNGIATGTMNFRTFSELAFSFRITPDLLISALIFSLVLGLVGGLLPSRLAARMPITKALREKRRMSPSQRIRSMDNIPAMRRAAIGSILEKWWRSAVSFRRSSTAVSRKYGYYPLAQTMEEASIVSCSRGKRYRNLIPSPETR